MIMNRIVRPVVYFDLMMISNPNFNFCNVTLI